MKLAIPRAALGAAACSLVLVSTLPATPRAASIIPAGERLVRVTDAGTTPCRVPRAVGTPVPLAARTARVAVTPAPQVRTDPATQATFVYWASRDGGLRVTTKTGELDVRKTVYVDGRFEILLQAGEDQLAVTVAAYNIDVERRGKHVRVDVGRDEEDDWLQVKQVLAGSKALRLFRALTAALDPGTLKTVAGAAMLSGDALLGYLDGDLGAIPRLADYFIRQRQAKLKAVSTTNDVDAGEKTCYEKYEQEVTKAAAEYNECRRSFEWWSGWQAACVLRWTLQVESAWFQFLACSAIPLKVE